VFLNELFLIVALSLNPAWPSSVRVTDSNATVTFEVDSTWHLVEGKMSGVSGALQIDSGDAVTGSISVPVALFNTERESRDERLREVMAAEQFPQVTLLFDGVRLGCAPADTVQPKGCSGTLSARLTIRDVTRTIGLPFTAKREGDAIVFSGTFSLEWAEYGVEDPSILIAKLDPTVSVTYKIILPPAS